MQSQQTQLLGTRWVLGLELNWVSIYYLQTLPNSFEYLQLIKRFLDSNDLNILTSTIAIKLFCSEPLCPKLMCLRSASHQKHDYVLCYYMKLIQVPIESLQAKQTGILTTQIKYKPQHELYLLLGCHLCFTCLE